MSQVKLSKVLSVVIVFLVASCGKYDLSAVNAYRPTYEDFSVDLGNKKIDVLFVVDNSGSMETEQKTLANSISGFINNFVGKPIDYHIGVLTTDTVMGGGNVAVLTSSQKMVYFPLSTFAIFDGPGSLFVRNIGLDGNVIVNRSAAGFDINQFPKYLDSSTMSRTDIINRFKIDALPGTSGSGNEAPLLSISRFLQADKLSGWNSGFLRPDSLFSVVIVSDEDESMTSCDVNSIDPYLKSQDCFVRQGSLGSPQDDYIQDVPDAKAARLALFDGVFRAQRLKRPALLSLDTVVALNPKYPDNSSCAGSNDNFGFLLQEVSKSYNRGTDKNSTIHNLCVSDFSTSISSIGNVLATSVENEFELDADRISPESVRVEINGIALEPDEFEFNPDTNHVKIKSFGIDTTTTSGMIKIRVFYEKRVSLSEL